MKIYLIRWLTFYFLIPGMIAAASAAQPNVLLIVADDLGWADLACYGSDLHETPNIDRLASEGVRFTDAYAASPVCTPTRASIMTGKHPARLHMTIWREAALNRGKRRLLEPLCLDSLPLEEVTLAEVFRDAGYQTTHIGKWHLGRAESYPQAHGFQINIGGTLWGAPQTFFYPYTGDTYFRGDWRYVPDLEPGYKGDYLTDRLTDMALEVIENNVAKKKPFFLNLWYHTVHTPIEGKAGLVAHYEKKITGKSVQKNPHYAAMVHSLDQNVGRVLAKLDALKITGETIVVFTSDNGGFVNTCKLHKDLQVANNSPLRSGKGSCWEGGIRIPLIVRIPNRGMAHTECSKPVISCDLYPTLLSLAGLGEKSGNAVDGIDLSSLVLKKSSGGEALQKRDTLFFHYPHYYPTTTPVSAVRRKNWKLLEFFEADRPVELYDLANDPGETKNLANTESEKRDELLQALADWRKAVNADIPESNPEAK